ncbi:MAG TPA: ATP-binding protein [Anaerolineales bacterium]
MKTRNPFLWWTFEHVLPWLVLAIILSYTYAKFFRHSFGFRVEPSTGLVVFVFDKQPEPTLRVNDRVLQLGSTPWEDFDANLIQPFLEGYRPGDTVPIRVERNGQQFDISWEYPHWNDAEFRDQFQSEWWLVYVFWFAGALTVLLVRPKDDSWALMSLFNFLTAIWLSAGSGLSAFHIWYSAITLRVAVWLCLPVYLHLHWVFPRPLGDLPRWLVGILYGTGILFAVAQLLQLLPTELYSLAFGLTLGGSLILLLIHLWRQPDIRRDFRLLWVALILAIVPSILWAIIDNLFGIPSIYGSSGILSLPLLPLAYLYTAFRRRLGNLELRVNRFLTATLFIILLAMVGLPFIAIADSVLNSSDKSLIIGVAAASTTIILGVWGYPAFERFVDRYIFAIPVTSKRLLEEFSTQITTSVSLSGLIRVLQEEVFPSLLIRQFAFLQCDQGSLTVLSRTGVEESQLPKEREIPELIARSGSYRPPDRTELDQPYAWIRLVLSLRLGDQLLGFWLFGRRDPDDLYSQREIPILSSLANLTAIALSNILQTERLKIMYESNIGRYEQERLRLSRDLHDSILNEMAALLMRSDSPVLSTEFQRAFEALTERLREIVSGLRPPTLTFGLKFALDELAENLSERNQNAVRIETHIQTDGDWRYPDLVEHHFYRIAQEACENALKYAHAKTISINAELSQQDLDIQVEDDGIGFQMETNRKLNEMLAHKHFGLVGMLERANLIGAEIEIESKLGEGTRIHIKWKPKESI